jgi:hypothetical protein
MKQLYIAVTPNKGILSNDTRLKNFPFYKKNTPFSGEAAIIHSSIFVFTIIIIA